MDYSAADKEIIDALEKAILDKVGGLDILKKEFPKRIRRALDEVIDTPRTGRLVLDELEKTEKTYIGTKVEILFRDLIGFPKGLLDLYIDGKDVDIKHSITNAWMIPNEAINKPCILISENEKTATCSLGLFVCRPEYLSQGGNRDEKRSIPAASYKHIRWLLRHHPYPKNFWEAIDAETAKAIFLPAGGTDRLLELLTRIQGTPIPRSVIEGVARQRDYMKRLRKNGGARDKLALQQIAVLWGGSKGHRDLLSSLGLLRCTKEEFLSYKPKDARELQLLRSYFDE